jgi:hypothetical protein
MRVDRILLAFLAVGWHAVACSDAPGNGSPGSGGQSGAGSGGQSGAGTDGSGTGATYGTGSAGTDSFGGTSGSAGGTDASPDAGTNPDQCLAENVAKPCKSNDECGCGTVCTGSGRGWCACLDPRRPGCFFPPCSNDSECAQYGPGAYCSHNGTRGFCALTKLGSGKSCADDTWCDSGKCVTGRCTGSKDTPTGTPCEADDWCVQGALGSGILCCPEGETGGNVCKDTNHSGGQCLKRLGQECFANFECMSSRCSNPFTGNRGVCTRDCTTHDNCGCAAGTTNDDIAAGACPTACATIGARVPVCLRVCGAAAQCGGNLVCFPTNAGFGVCEAPEAS